ncbi:hypothetical protein GCK72_023860 [Caenorhabditis remanei]|uniref:Uncharacterized protein n=1 Tax=Caenorhabditis remanei TaxID=31234 RepID=A0A6A5FXJ9_CAERE|nr:hypothetical protein GCK72_023860 [Caenorhabditis remanei]KAF1747398.1 hypothetical protein GCK72_023860 [Caenorhabditis remanei]
MSKPVIFTMKEFVNSEIAKITAEHEKIILGWKNVELTEENTTHLYNLFKKCKKPEIRIFEDNNFLGDAETVETYELITKKLVRVDKKSNESEIGKGQVETNKPTKSQCKKKQKKKKGAESSTSTLNSANEPEAKAECTALISNNRANSENTNETTDEKQDEASHSSPPPNADEVIFKAPLIPKSKSGKKSRDEIEEYAEHHSEEMCSITTYLSEISPVSTGTENPEPKKKIKNPFDNDDLFIEPLLSSTPNTKPTEEEEELMVALGNKYISQESTKLRNSLRRLASDISTEEELIRTRMESGESATVHDSVLQDFISRANTVLKETEAVTVRKIAEAETKKFLASINVPAGDTLETISNELMHDIWPKSNRWRSFARVENYIPVTLDEEELKNRKKQEELVERDVKTAIKSAGESLNKRQISQIRKAAVTYREFDAKEEKELEYRNSNTLKLVQLVSEYEVVHKMDEFILLRLGIAFCTKRRDYYLRVRPPNFMQFSYMYIFFLEKINSDSASLCACLNYLCNNSTDFLEIEEVLLNLFHEDYFLEMDL